VIPLSGRETSIAGIVIGVLAIAVGAIIGSWIYLAGGAAFVLLGIVTLRVDAWADAQAQRSDDH
jgi:hypothetical protein